jgi:hypothetical protein
MLKLVNIILSTVAFFCFFSLHAQINSYEFKITLPPQSEPVKTIDAQYFGSYRATDEWIKYNIRAEGIFIETITHMSILRETIRESSTYFVRNGYLFGVTKDSVPCFLEGERFYYGLKSEIEVIGNNSKNLLTRMGKDNYIINYFDNGSYTPSRLIFSGNQLIIEHFDYEDQTSVFSNIETKDKAGLRILLSPTIEEWNKIDKKIIFPIQQRLKKE